jgi:hypothetical protein
MERAAMNRRTLLAGLAIVAFLPTMAMMGCRSIGAATGAAAGIATGTVTTNPAIGIGVGIAVQAATDEAVKRTTRRLHGDQQDAIAAIAGQLAENQTGTWRVKHWLPVENGHGQVRVTRTFSTPLALCKEFLFSVAHGNAQRSQEDWYRASACRQRGQWKWAAAEPAVARWGNLQ